MTAAVVCWGAINVDLIFRADTLADLPREVGEVRAGGEYALSAGQEAALRQWLGRAAELAGLSGGGQAANTAFALGRWGIPTALVGRVGADRDGDFLLGELPGVDCRGVRRQGTSGRAYVLVDAGGERTIFVAPNTNDLLREEELPRDGLGRARWVHLSSYVGEAPLAVQTAWAATRPAALRVSLDPGELYARRGRARLRPLLAGVDTLILTASEWRELGGDDDAWPPWAPPTVIVKRGAAGARLLSPQGALEAPGQAAAAVVDTLGAGDVFAAGWLAAQYHGLTPAAALNLANRLAAASLAGRGRAGYPEAAFFREALAAARVEQAITQNMN